MIQPLYFPNPQQASVVTLKPETRAQYRMRWISKEEFFGKIVVKFRRFLTIKLVVLYYIHGAFIHIAEDDIEIRKLLTKLLNHESHEKVELPDQVVYGFNALSILTPVLPQVVRRTTNRCQPHDHEFPNINAIQVLYHQALSVRKFMKPTTQGKE
jgi:hypothetical protein